MEKSSIHCQETVPQNSAKKGHTTLISERASWSFIDLTSHLTRRLPQAGLLNLSISVLWAERLAEVIGDAQPVKQQSWPHTSASVGSPAPNRNVSSHCQGPQLMMTALGRKPCPGHSPAGCDGCIVCPDHYWVRTVLSHCVLDEEDALSPWLDRSSERSRSSFHVQSVLEFGCSICKTFKLWLRVEQLNVRGRSTLAKLRVRPHTK